MKNYILILLLFAVSWTALGQAPVQRNPWSTNVTGNAVRGNNNLSVTNLGSLTNWLFYGVQAATIARLTDITNHGTGLFVLKTGDTMTGPLATVGFTNTGGMTNTGTIYSSGQTIAQGTITDPLPALSVSGAWNDVADTFIGLLVNMTNQASAGSYLMDLQTNSVSKFRVSQSGGLTASGLSYFSSGYYCGGSSPYYWNGRSRIYSGGDGYIDFYNSTLTDFYGFRFGGTASTNAQLAYTSAGRDTVDSTPNLEVKLGDGSDWTDLSFKRLIANDAASVVGNARGVCAQDLGSRNNAAYVASGVNSIVLGGTNNTASASFAAAGGRSAAAVLYGQDASAAGMFASPGDAQVARLKARATMTIATSSVTNLFLDGASATLTLPANTSWGCTIQVVGRGVDAGTGDEESAYYEIKCLFERDNAAANTRLVGSATKVVVAEDDAAWDADVSADTTNGALTITVTGNNETTVRWNATVYLTQLGG